MRSYNVTLNYQLDCLQADACIALNATVNSQARNMSAEGKTQRFVTAEQMAVFDNCDIRNADGLFQAMGDVVVNALVQLCQADDDCPLYRVREARLGAHIQARTVHVRARTLYRTACSLHEHASGCLTAPVHVCMLARAPWCPLVPPDQSTCCCVCVCVQVYNTNAEASDKFVLRGRSELEYVGRFLAYDPLPIVKSNYWYASCTQRLRHGATCVPVC
jgi:hypothetical protein